MIDSCLDLLFGCPRDCGHKMPCSMEDRSVKRNFARRDTGFTHERGQSLILVTLSMMVLMGFMGLAIDVGCLRADQRKLQQAADAAALAGALEISYCTYSSGSACTRMQDAAAAAVAENGFAAVTPTSDQCTAPTISGLTLVLNWGPCLLGSSDPNNGSKRVVEAEVGQVFPTTFSSLFGLGTVKLTARAEAGRGRSSYCMYIDASDYGKTGAGTFDVESGGHVNLSCGIQDDGTLTSKGNGSHVTATQFEVSASSGVGSNQFNPTPVFNAPQVPDPICASYPTGMSQYNTSSNCSGNIAYSDPESNCTSWTTLTSPYPTGTLSPGCYAAPSSGCSAVSVKNNGFGNDVNTYCDAVTLGANLTLSSGTYIFNGDVDLAGYNLSGSGVTLYFKGGSIINGSSSTVNLSAPTSGNYEGMLIWESPLDLNTMALASASTSIWNGTVYLPYAVLDLSDGANAQLGCSAGDYSIIDAYSVEDAHGSKTFALCNDYSQLSGGNPISAYTAVLSE